jgi:DNA primase
LAAGVAAEVKSRLLVADVVGETVALKKAGTTLKGLCPFHGEKTPSFVVTPARETWKCFGCGKGGDIFSFVMERDGLSFPEALRVLAAKAGVELDDRTRRDDARKARLREVLDTAIVFYHTVLTASKTGAPALDYLRGRGFSDETISKFQLGYAPGGWDVMARRLIDKRQMRPEELAEVGLTTVGRRGPIDRFRERVIFPIRDANGNAVGLGGRLMPGVVEGRDRGPKYLNSPATPLFDKSRTLYLIDRAKGAIRRGGQAVLVEGYTDALMAHQAGFDNVVASLGTALTPGQVAVLTRYGKRIALAYDVDPAGQSAGTFGVTELTALISEVQASGTVGLTDVGVVRMPEGKDPDEVIRDTPSVWSDAVAHPLGIIDYLIDANASRVDVRTADGRRRLVESVVPALRRVADPIVRDGAIRRLAQRAAVDDELIREALRGRPSAALTADAGASSDHAGVRLTLEAVRAADVGVRPDEVVRAVTRAEAELLRLLLLLPELQLRAADELAPDQLPSALARELYRAIVLMRAPDDAGVPGRWDLAAFRAGLDEEAEALATAVLVRGGPDYREHTADRQVYALENLILDLEAERIKDRSDYNRAAQAEAELAGDTAAMAELLAQERQINEERRSLDRRREQARMLARAGGSGAGAAGGASTAPKVPAAATAGAS